MHRFILTQEFDHVVRIERPDLNGFPDTDKISKLWCWTLHAWNKCVFLDPNTLIRKSCEELFDLDQLSAVPNNADPRTFDPSLFVYKPSTTTFGQLIDLAENLKTGKLTILLGKICRIFFKCCILCIYQETMNKY